MNVLLKIGWPSVSSPTNSYPFLMISRVCDIFERHQKVVEEEVEEGEVQELIEEDMREGILMRVMRWFWRIITRATSRMRIWENLLEEVILGEEDM